MTKAERTRSFIIEKAAPIVNRKGMAGTSITDIMEATKLAKGGIYGNFESKEEICKEALDYLISNAGAAMQARIAARTSPLDQLYALFGYYLDSVNNENLYGCPMLNFGAEADDTDPVIRARVSKAISATENLFRGILQAGIDQRIFKPSLEAKNFALKCFTMIEGGMWMCRVQGDRKKMLTIIDLLKKEIEGYLL